MLNMLSQVLIEVPKSAIPLTQSQRRRSSPSLKLFNQNQSSIRSERILCRETSVRGCLYRVRSTNVDRNDARNIRVNPASKVGLATRSTPRSTLVSTWLGGGRPQCRPPCRPVWVGIFPPSLFWLILNSEFKFELFFNLKFSENFDGP